MRLYFKKTISLGLLLSAVCCPVWAQMNSDAPRPWTYGHSIEDVAVSPQDYPYNKNTRTPLANRYYMNDEKQDRTSYIDDSKVVFLYNVNSRKFLTSGYNWGTMAILGLVGTPFLVRKHTIQEYDENNVNATPRNVVRYSFESLFLEDKKDTKGVNKFFGFVLWDFGGYNKDSLSTNNFYHDRTILNTGDRRASSYFNFIPYTQSEGNQTYLIQYYTDLVHKNKTYYDMKGLASSLSYLCVRPNRNKDYAYLDCPIRRNTDRTYSPLINNVEKAMNDSIGVWKIITLKDLKEDLRRRYSTNELVTNLSNLIRYQDFSSGLIPTETDSFKNPNAWVPENVSWGVFTSQRPQTYRFARIKGTQGRVYQDVYINKSGWYVVSVKGFYAKKKSSNTTKSYLFAEVLNENTLLSSDETLMFERNVYKANVSLAVTRAEGALLYEDSDYKQYVAVYVPEDRRTAIRIGVRIESNVDTDYALMDDFELYYYGNSTNYLDEDEENITYIQKQVEGDRRLADLNVQSNVVLQRGLKPRQWNSITLPLSLTKKQYLLAFGTGTKLAHFEGQDPNEHGRLLFRTINMEDVNDNDTVFLKRQMYLVYPAEDLPTTGEETITERFENYDIHINGTYVKLVGVNFGKEEVENHPLPVEVPFTTAQGGYDNVAFVGTYFNTDNAIEPGSYFLGKDTQWYHTSKYYRSKGFRGWIKTLSGTPIQPTMLIEGLVTNTITGIDERVIVHQVDSQRVYNMRGQLVRNDGRLDGLAPGIYIVGKKKVVVK